MDKKEFLLEEFCEILLSIDENTKPLFGKMNFGQMVVHFSDSVRIANGKATFDFKERNSTSEVGELACIMRFPPRAYPIFS